MDRLPNAERAIVADEKVTDYLLSPSHPIGRSKASFFQRFGFQRTSWWTLRDALLELARDGQVVEAGMTDFGVKYIVDGRLNAPDGRAPWVRSVWTVRRGEDVPRLVTAYPAAGGDA